MSASLSQKDIAERGRGGVERMKRELTFKWDFSAAQLHRPRHHHANSSHHRIAGSTVSLQNTGTGTGHGRSQSNLPLQTSTRGRYHPAPPRSEVALLQPVMVSSLLPFLLIHSVHCTSYLPSPSPSPPRPRTYSMYSTLITRLEW